jgi:hypothetical protein
MFFFVIEFFPDFWYFLFKEGIEVYLLEVGVGFEVSVVEPRSLSCTQSVFGYLDQQFLDEIDGFVGDDVIFGEAEFDVLDFFKHLVFGGGFERGF